MILGGSNPGDSGVFDQFAKVMFCGLLATLIGNSVLRGGFFFCGCLAFLSVVRNMDLMIVQVTESVKPLAVTIQVSRYRNRVYFGC